MIDFGTTVIGETIKRSFTLSNRGALGTKFDFFKVTGESVWRGICRFTRLSVLPPKLYASRQYTAVLEKHGSEHVFL